MGQERRARRRAGRRTNVALLVLLALAFATGWAAFGTGATTLGRIVTVLHGTAGLALVLLIPWKSLIVRRSRAFRSVPWRGAAGIILGVLVSLSLLAGVVHVLGGFRTYAGLIPMQVRLPYRCRACGYPGSADAHGHPGVWSTRGSAAVECRSAGR